MSISGIVTAVMVIGIVGLLIGLFLGIAAIKFKVDVDEREERITEVLPGNNCGGCGYPGCSNLAVAIVKNQAPADACPVGGKSVAQKVAEIMGVKVEEGVRKVAFVKCGGTCENTTNDYEYTGVKDCKMLSFVPNGGPKSCNEGCLGYGNCVKICPFDAIHIEHNIAVVDEEKCKACGKCIAECPKQLIELVPFDAKYKVKCSSKEKGQITMKVCTVGCIACGICEKVCESSAVKIEENHAYIDQEKCIGCGMCAQKCPKKCIV